MELTIRFADNGLPAYHYDPKGTWVKDGLFCVRESGESVVVVRYPMGRIDHIEERSSEHVLQDEGD